MLTGTRAFAANSQAGLIAAIPSTTRPRSPHGSRSSHPRSNVSSRPAREESERTLAACAGSGVRAQRNRRARWGGARPAGDRESGAGAAAGRWRPHAAWALLVVVLGLMLWSVRPAGNDPPPNPRPVVVLMDSPGRAYDAATKDAGGTNADDVSDALRDLPVVMFKENTSSSGIVRSRSSGRTRTSSSATFHACWTIVWRMRTRHSRTTCSPWRRTG